MISQISINTIQFLRKKIPHHSIIIKQLASSETPKNNITNKDENNKLKNWRQIAMTTKKPFISDSKEFFLFKIIQSEVDFNPWAISKFFKKKALLADQALQKINPLLEESVGFEIALGYFVVYQGGKVKYRGHDKWIGLNEDKVSVDLPKNYDPNYIVTEIDVSDITLYYESLLNFRNTQRIKRAIFKRSPLFDDWYIDRLSSYFPYLEYLDISNCPNVTEKGLEALYRCSDLKTLIITNYSKTSAFELTCLMLEDCIPRLRVKILEPKEITKFDVKQIKNE